MIQKMYLERNEKIFRLRVEDKMTYTQIATLYALSAPRVRQIVYRIAILKKYNLKTRGYLYG